MTDGISPRHAQLRLGAAYYYEYPVADGRPDLARLNQDLEWMVRAGINLIRVGESVWSTWEPRAGEFDLDWLQPVLDGAHSRGIDVILGTPTYALPMWLATAHPELAGDPVTGQPMGWGARQEMDFTHPDFRRYAERVIRAVVGRYGTHPAVVGIQVDNEPGLRELRNEGVFVGFRRWLKRTYGDVANLNERWGLTYWSHLLTSYEELWRPENNWQPQYHLAWRRFQAELVREYISWQAKIVREIVGTGPDAPRVTTCLAYEQVSVDDVWTARSLDVTSANVYFLPQDSLAVPNSAPPSRDWMLEGTWAVYELADRAYSTKQQEYWVTETNAGGIGQSAFNLPPYPGQLRQIAWALVSRGARAVEYWHWHTLQYGSETFWIGIIPHDGQPGRIYEETARLGAEFAAAGDMFSGAEPEADVAFVYSLDSKRALSSPQLSQARDPQDAAGSYHQLALPFYRGAFESGLQVRTVRPEQLVGDDALFGAADRFAAAHPVLVWAGAFVASDAELLWMQEYVIAGGHLIVGPRTADADTEARVRRAPKPAGLSRLAGVSYQEFQTLDAPVELELAEAASSGTVNGTVWAQYLVPDGAQVLARYRHPQLGAYAAVTTNAVGAGRVTVVGTVLDAAGFAALYQWAVPSAVAKWPELPDSCRVTSARLADGRQALFLHHWGQGEVEAVAPRDLIDAIEGARIPRGASLALEPWDVRILVR